MYIALKDRSKVVKNFSAFNEMSKLLCAHGIASEGQGIDLKIAEVIRIGLSPAEEVTTHEAFLSTSYRLVDYKTYCCARQVLQGLRAGTAVSECDARKLRLLSTCPATLLFTRNETFIDDQIDTSKRVAFDTGEKGLCVLVVNLQSRSLSFNSS